MVMENIIQDRINEFEMFIGFPVKRKETLAESNNSHDESFSYNLCQRFYGQDAELELAIARATSLLILLTKESGFSREKELLFSLLGNLYYLQGDFERSIGCFLKALSSNKKDLTNLIELAFALRASGRISIFEDIIFNLERMHFTLRDYSQGELNKDRILEIIGKAKGSTSGL
jgi:tetratricopeptide (TPR) repeat protein